MAEYVFQAAEKPQSLILKVNGSLNFANSPNLMSAMDQQLDIYLEQNSSLASESDKAKLDCTNPTHVILELSGVPSMDPSAWSEIRDFHKSLATQGRRLWLVGLQGEVWRSALKQEVFQELPVKNCFPCLQDALTILKERRRLSLDKRRKLMSREK